MPEKLKVLIVESSGPQDFYSEELDGPLTYNLTKVLGIDAKLVYGVNLAHFKKAIALAAKMKCNVLHISCHGRKKGLTLTDKTPIDWPDLAQMFEATKYSPTALVMSSCWGGVDEIANEFEHVTQRPEIIFGPTDNRFYNEYAIAWTLLYNAFSEYGVERKVTQRVLREVCATAHKSFRYLRWYGDKKEYLVYPGEGREYEIVEKKKPAKKRGS